MLRWIAAFTIAVSLSAAAQAQSTPNPVMEKIFPHSPGVERSLQSYNNSGQVGTVTLHKIDEENTDVVLNVKSTVSGRPEFAGIVRDPAGTCETPPSGPHDFTLANVVGGASHSQVRLPINQLLSGNYLVIVYSNEKPSHVFSCGKLYH